MLYWIDNTDTLKVLDATGPTLADFMAWFRQTSGEGEDRA